MPTIKQINKKIRKFGIQIRKDILSQLIDPNAWKDSDWFFALLKCIKELNLVHYSRLAQTMGYRDSTTVFRWFKGESLPDSFRRQATLKVLTQLIRYDLERLEKSDSYKPVGGLSMRIDPKLYVKIKF